MSKVLSTDPRTGATTGTGIKQHTPAEAGEVAARARAAFNELAGRDRAWRTRLLRAMADELDERRPEIVGAADAETGLGEARLNGELTRTCFQLRLFADTVAEGGYLEATIDHAGQTGMGPRPDLRRMLIPIGPVVVFGASNFPLAFSVPGGDTAAALAAGCPVIVKAHESHPRTSEVCGSALAAAAAALGAPEGTIAVVHGREAGARLVQHPDVAAVGFTGSRVAAAALLDLINQRPDPIPFYGELSGINPLVVTDEAAAERGEEIGAGLAGSFTLGAGQFCTKPGLAFIPRTDAGDRLLTSLSEAVAASGAQVLLNERISEGFASGAEHLASLPEVAAVSSGATGDGTGFTAQVRLLAMEAAAVDERVAQECFGPVLIAVRYSGRGELLDALARLEPSLTATVHLGEGEAARSRELLDELQELSGRLVFNGYPTGVAVSWAQHHGGPWPSTNAIHTSVGPTAVRRFLRPYAWQDAPAEVLPPELRDEPVAIPRRVDGVLTPPATG